MFYIVYIGVPILLLLLFALKRPRLAPLTLLFCPVVDFLVYHQEFLYYESRGLVLLFTGIQVVLTAIPAFIIRAKGRKQKGAFL